MAGESDEAFWDERYRAHHHIWSGQPNRFLVEECAGLAPGTALDVGCGEGADAIWLAERGWLVTGVDVSSVALERAAEHAARAGVGARVDWRHADLTVWHPDTGRFDLVSAQYLHLPPEPRQVVFRRLAEAVAPAGTLLFVGHHPSDLETSIRRPNNSDLYFTGGEIAATLAPDGWTIVSDVVRPRTATDHDGRPVTVHDMVFRAQRLAAA